MLDLLGGGLIGGAIGGTIGAVGGYLDAQAKDQAARDVRKEIRSGVGQAQADSIRQAAGVLGSSDYRAASSFIRGLYGLGPQDPNELYNQLLGVYGGNAAGPSAYGGPGGSLAAGAFGYGLKGYGQGGNSIAAQNQSYVQQMLGLSGNNVQVNEMLQGKQVGPMTGMGAQLTGSGGAGEILSASAAGYGQMARAEASGGAGNLALRNVGQGANPFLANQDAAASAQLSQAAAPFNSGNPLYSNYTQALSQSLAARGLGGGMAAAGTVASGLAGYQTQLQLEQIPTLLQLASAPMDYASRFSGFGGNAQRDVFAATGGQAVYGQVSQAAMDTGPMAGLRGALNGAAAGFGAGASIGSGFSGGGLQSNPGYRPGYPMSQVQPAFAGSDSAYEAWRSSQLTNAGNSYATAF
jgi:hypothetical protein